FLNYLACHTCPNPAPAVSILSSFNNAPGINHWRQVIQCWKYLAGTTNVKLTPWPDSKDTLKAIQHFTDTTWADDIETRLSRSGSICFRKSSEMNTLSDGLYNENLNPSQFNVNNKGLIDKINNFSSNSKNKHLDIKAKWLRNLKKNNEILVKLIPSEAMIADTLTKPSNQESLIRLKAKCFLVTFVFSSTAGGVETWLLENSCDT
ncbi:hypothetical protein VP01_8972g2, partial [Puccinia sorghi]